MGLQLHSLHGSCFICMFSSLQVSSILVKFDIYTRMGDQFQLSWILGHDIHSFKMYTPNQEGPLGHGNCGVVFGFKHIKTFLNWRVLCIILLTNCFLYSRVHKKRYDYGSNIEEDDFVAGQTTHKFTCPSITSGWAAWYWILS